ncbi:MAG TPA: sodium-dependent transporter [Gemmatimonadota bacterium]|nr:sodium-dependent transporter [Gemmatimonadota bacterium]
MSVAIGNGTGVTFSTRWAMLLAMLSMAVGTGNIWRFPRIAATNDGGTFLIPWAIFLLTWSVPLLICEFAMGKGTRRGPIGAFSALIGERFAWMGAWVALCTIFIMFYYGVVTGWCLRYFTAAVAGELPGAEPAALWTSYAESGWAVATLVLSLALAVVAVARGVRGIEAVTKVLMPVLLLLVLVLAVRAVTLPGAERGLAFLFTPDLSGLGDSRVWLEALTQNAWDTGAGWGLALTYAVYLRAREDTTINAFILGFGNNSVSLLAGIMVLCTVFSIRPDAASEIVGAGNTGLTFIWVPQLFAALPGGQLFMALFFLALFFAALTSLISMIELGVRALIDRGWTRGRALTLVTLMGLVAGVPSALSMAFFENQDNVWGVGLMLSGLFFAVGVLRYGVDRFRERFVNSAGSDLTIGRWWNAAIVLVAAEAVALLVWWFSQTLSAEGWRATLDPFRSWSLGTFLLQWGVLLALILAFNRGLAGPSRPAAAVGPAAVPGRPE